MLFLIASLIASVEAPNVAPPAVVCAVGRAALRDLPFPHLSLSGGVNYFDADPRRHGLLEVCPSLRADIPAGYSVADEDAWTRANTHVPVPGQTILPASIYDVSVPKISSNGRYATVEWGYTCTGLCGSRFVAHYILSSGMWRRERQDQVKSVS